MKSHTSKNLTTAETSQQQHIKRLEAQIQQLENFNTSAWSHNSFLQREVLRLQKEVHQFEKHKLKIRQLRVSTIMIEQTRGHWLETGIVDKQELENRLN